MRYTVYAESVWNNVSCNCWIDGRVYSIPFGDFRIWSRSEYDSFSVPFSLAYIYSWLAASK